MMSFVIFVSGNSIGLLRCNATRWGTEVPAPKVPGGRHFRAGAGTSVNRSILFEIHTVLA